MKWPGKRPEPEPPSQDPPPEHIAEAKRAFETQAPGVGVCNRCGQAATKRHRCG